jgi:hypothetical protein
MPGRAAAVHSGAELRDRVVGLGRQLGLDARTELRVGRRLWGAVRCIDVVLTRTDTGKTLGVECKFQGGGGSAEERFRRPFRISKRGPSPASSCSGAWVSHRIWWRTSTRPVRRSPSMNSNRGFACSLASLTESEQVYLGRQLANGGLTGIRSHTTSPSHVLSGSGSGCRSAASTAYGTVNGRAPVDPMLRPAVRETLSYGARVLTG